MRMATYASRPAWELRARAVSTARVAVPLGIGALMALSVLLRTRQLDVGFWIDEGLSVGIADRPVGDIPGVLRQDGSPPLYYMLLSLWMDAFGTSESAVHSLSAVHRRARDRTPPSSGRVMVCGCGRADRCWACSVAAAASGPHRSPPCSPSPPHRRC